MSVKLTKKEREFLQRHEKLHTAFQKTRSKRKPRLISAYFESRDEAKKATDTLFGKRRMK